MARESDTTALPSACEEFPTFDLTYRYDDSDDPSEITVFPAGETRGQTTTWLTVRREDAVSLEEVR